jgi:hypothetical protein
MNDSITLPHPADDLRGKNIVFRIRIFAGDPLVEMSAEGEGVLSIDGPDDNGRYDAVIYSDGFDSLHGGDEGPGVSHGSFLYLDQRAADCLRVLEDGTLTCLDATLPKVG